MKDKVPKDVTSETGRPSSGKGNYKLRKSTPTIIKKISNTQMRTESNHE